MIILCLQRTIDDYEVQNAIYGQVQFYWKKRTDAPQIVEQGDTRIENSFYEEENSDIVTTIAAYKRDYSKKDSLIGRLYHPPYQVNPRNPLDREIRLRIRDALFGDNENSDWKSLTKIEEINQEMAKRLHDNGIEDLGILAIASDEELEIKGFNIGELKKFQNDARRIINALSTGSIRFLKGIDNGTYKLLTEKGIYLITQILEKTNNPEGITPSKWDEIVKDGEAIMKE